MDLDMVRAFLERQRLPLFLLTLASDRFTSSSTAAIKRYVRSIAPFVQPTQS